MTERTSTAKTFLGATCRRGHNGLRYASNGACVDCTKASIAARREEARDAAMDEGRGPRKYRRGKVRIVYSKMVAKSERYQPDSDWVLDDI